MGVEIERRFLVTDDAWRPAAASREEILQGYLAASPALSVRVRRAGARAWLAVKGPARGAVRSEFEYEIPAADADALLALCGGARVEKTRHRVVHAGRTWEVDEFRGENAGLVVAEIELEDEADHVEPPPWAGAEVTGDPRYLNASLARAPYSRWTP